MDNLLSDLRYGVRQMRTHAVFTGIVASAVSVMFGCGAIVGAIGLAVTSRVVASALYDTNPLIPC